MDFPYENVISAKTKVREKTSAFGFFVKLCGEEHAKRYPDEPNDLKEIDMKCKERWKTMTKPEKSRFEKLAAADAERWESEMGVKKKVKRKREKDPNAPKRALSGYFMFAQINRARIIAANPELKAKEVMSENGRLWSALPEDEKKAYEALSTLDKQRAIEEMDAYKLGKTITSSRPAAAALIAEADKALTAGKTIMEHVQELNIDVGPETSNGAAAHHEEVAAELAEIAADGQHDSDDSEQ